MSRDDQFLGFGRAVIMSLLKQRVGGWIDFNEDNTEEIEEYSAIVARAAYALVEHEMAFRRNLDDPYGDIEVIPDLPELPEETAE